jgi:Tol biopolymer transport system component
MSTDEQNSIWQKTKTQHLIRYLPKGTFYAYFKVGGKPFRKSLRTHVYSVAKLRLRDEIAEQHELAEASANQAAARLTFADVVEQYCARIKSEPRLKPASRHYRLMTVDFIVKSWPAILTKKITPLITGGINTYGSWSPDMKHIALRKIIGDENSEVFVADGDGSNLRNLTNNPFFDGWPAWSPDGRTIAFASNRRGHGYQIFVVNADGANPRLVANTEGRGTAPRWSSDRKAIYFTNCVAKDYGADCGVLVARLEQIPHS